MEATEKCLRIAISGSTNISYKGVKMSRRLLISFMPVFLLAGSISAQEVPRDKFISVTELAPDIQLDMAYYGADNFVGARINGYDEPVCLLSIPAAEALGKVHEELKEFGLALKVFDCYRPQRAVDHFVSWASDVDDQAKKVQYYPEVEKSRVFKLGYVATKSGHSRGSTVDLTIVELDKGPSGPFQDRTEDCRYGDDTDPRELNMGTGYDCFDPLSHTENPHVDAEARRNRLLLRAIMEKYGFDNYSKEWWHFTYRNEPFRQEYFDFPVAWK